jgi:hypothetical protein
MIACWIIYDFLVRTPLGQNSIAFSALGLVTLGSLLSRRLPRLTPVGA